MSDPISDSGFSSDTNHHRAVCTVCTFINVCTVCIYQHLHFLHIYQHLHFCTYINISTVHIYQHLYWAHISTCWSLLPGNANRRSHPSRQLDAKCSVDERANLCKLVFFFKLVCSQTILIPSGMCTVPPLPSLSAMQSLICILHCRARVGTVSSKNLVALFALSLRSCLCPMDWTLSIYMGGKFSRVLCGEFSVLCFSPRFSAFRSIPAFFIVLLL